MKTSNQKTALVVPDQFIQAVRDSGYKNLASALAELIDNALEARANRIRIIVSNDSDEITVCVADNGSGMPATMLRYSLQFGWSSRFNSRNGFGRYGMGLPNASLSIARRVEVYSRAASSRAFMTALDVDDVCAGNNNADARVVNDNVYSRLNPFRHGTAVVWRKCDRINITRLPKALKRCRRELGRLFRYQLWGGKKISLNGEDIAPIDPLLERKGDNLVGAKQFGPQLRYEVVIPEDQFRTSPIFVRFTELPVNRWHELSNAEKNTYGIAKNAGVSILRAGREIDHGWYFMGDKRKENYDDWWRCEVSFEPDLDALFGVTHSKQEIRPTEALTNILAPEIESIARSLNARVRASFTRVKKDASDRPSERQAQLRDGFLEPPESCRRLRERTMPKLRVGRSACVAGIEYRFRTEAISNGCFFRPHFFDGRLTVFVNKEHAFIEQALANGYGATATDRRHLELLLFAAARAELMVAKQADSKPYLTIFRDAWSKVLKAFYA